MSLGLAFWILWLVGLVFGVWRARADWSGGIDSLFWFILTGLLAWRVFGPPIHG